MEAVKSNLDVVKSLVEGGLSPLVRDKHRNTLLHLCCISEHCQLDILQYLLENVSQQTRSTLRYLRNINGSLLLHLACASGKETFVRFLVPQYFKFEDFVIPDYWQQTSLYLACKRGHYSIASYALTCHNYLSSSDICQCILVSSSWQIMLLLFKLINFNDFVTEFQQRDCTHFVVPIPVTNDNIEFKCRTTTCLHLITALNDVHSSAYLHNSFINCDFNTPLHIALQYNCCTSLSKYFINLLEYDFEVKNKFNDRLLYLACESGNIDIVCHFVVNKHCDINVKGIRGCTPLHRACEKGHFEIVQFLTDQPQCNIDAEDDDKDKPLHLACESGNIDIVRHFVVNKHCDINVKGIRGCTPLHRACEKGHFEIVQFLTDQPQCNIDAEDDDKDKPLHLACESGNIDIVRHLVVDKHCDINVKGVVDHTPLHRACWKGHFEIVQFLTDQPQCNIDIGDDYIDKPLALACDFGNIDIVHHLVVNKHCDINVKGIVGYTPLHSACLHGHFEIVQFLTDQPQCNLDAKNDNKDRPLHLACNSGNIDIVHHLVVDKHCDINVKGAAGHTPLHRACEKDHFEIVQILTDQPQCNIDVEDDDKDRPIHLACESGNIDIVRHLVVDKHCDINVKGVVGYTPLHMACLEGHFEIVQFLTDQPQCNIDAENDNKDRPLHLACESGNIDIVRHLVVDKHCDINVKGIRGYTPLRRACGRGHFEIVQFLTDQPQCNIDTEDDDKNKPLHLACEFGNIDIVRHLVVDKHCDINVKGIRGYTPLHNACGRGHFEIVQFLTDQPQCNIDAENDNKDRPLHLACESGNIDIVRHLVVDKHCDINVKGVVSYTPLHNACEKGHFEIVQFLTDQPQCNIDAENDDKDRPLHLACESGNIDIVYRLVVDKHCDINVKGVVGYTPLHSACEKGHFEIVQFLTDQPQCNIDAENDDKDRPLHLACESGNIDIVCHLVVDQLCDINVKGFKGATPLHNACGRGHFEIAQLLTDQPQCNIDAENDDKDRPIHLACESGNIDIVRHLVVDKHCDINVKGFLGHTPLHNACEKGQFEIVQFLTDQPQCKVNAEDDDKNRPLHSACESGTIDIVRHFVVDKHCDINVKGIRGYTPLHRACGRGHCEIVQFLTDQPQCNIDAENEDKNKPLHLACESGNIDIVRHLVVDKHCDINVKGATGHIPLHKACWKGHFEIVQFLTDQPQCNIDAEDDDKDRPLHLALYSRNVDIVHHLVFIKQCFTNSNDMNEVAQLASSSVKNFKHFVSSQLPKHKLQFLIPSQSSGIYLKYQLALQSKGIASLKVVKCILTGPPGAGKSTLKKKLLNESLTEPSFSTGVADAAVQVNYRKLEQCNAQALITTEWKKQVLGEEVVLLLDKIASKRADHVNAVSTYQTDQPSDLHTDKTVGYNSDSEEFIQESEEIQENKTSFDVYFNEINSCDIEEPNQSEPTDENDMDSSTQENETSLSAESHMKKGIDTLSNFVTKNISNKKRKEYEDRIQQDNDHATIHIIDTGGQPEFHEMLPALITGPAINLLVFKLTEDLRSRYKVTYRSSSGDSEPYLTSLTHEEVIFRSLASIACLRQNTIGWNFDKLPIKDDSEPAAFLIATHKDEVDESKVNEVNQQLKTKIQSSPELFHENLVQFSNQDSVIFALDTRNDDQMIDELRRVLHQVISEKFCELQIPASWCAFSVELRKSKRSHCTCYKLAQECGINDESDFHSVLWYLHHRVGSIMYYPEVKDLKDIIITDLQLVFDRITELIRSCFTFKALQDPSVDYEFYKNGRFSEADLTKISSSKEKRDSFTPKRLVSLLKHLYILAGPMKTKVGRKTVNYYFMPCALKPTQVENVQQSASCPVPLLISFECGYTPVGVFCCLVVYLLSQTSLKWKLQEEEETVHYRNKITFEVGKFYDSVAIISHATFLEVLVHRQKTSKLSTDSLCEQVLSVLHNGLIAVTKSLHYTYKSKHLFGFYCHCSPSLLPHSAVIEHCPEIAKCGLSKRKMVLDDRYLSWSKKVK